MVSSSSITVWNFASFCLTLFNGNHRWARVFGQGGGGHRGVSSKKFSGRLRQPENFFAGAATGGEIFFRWDVYLVHRGVKIFFSRGAPPCFFHAGCRANFRLKGGGCPPPHPPPVPIYDHITLSYL